MADGDRTRKQTQAEVGKAAGITLASFGGVTVFKDMHILENGSFHLDSLIHAQLAGEASRMTVSDGGVSLNCDPRWAINTFTLGAPGRLDPGPSTPRGVDGAGLLQARVQAVAQTLRDEAQVGDIVLVGSTDPVRWGQKAAQTNAGLAQARADTVRGLLDADLKALPSREPPRNVIVFNDKLTLNAAPADAANAGPGGLARALFGVKEASGRSVLVCVLEPRPHGIALTGGPAAGAGQTQSVFLAGAAAGLGASIVLAVIAAIAGRGAWLWLNKNAG